MSKKEPCPYCTTNDNWRTFGPKHPCFTIYDTKREAGK